MVQKFSFSVEERIGNTACEIECSEMFNQMIENGDHEYLLALFEEALTVLTRRLQEEKCHEEFSEDEIDILSAVLGLIEEE